MKETAMMQMLKAIPRCQKDLRDYCEKLLQVEENQIVEAFNKGAIEEMYDRITYYNGAEYFEKNYTQSDNP